MDILYLLVPLSVVLVFVIGAIFWWAVRSGQFDDLEGPAHRILMDDDGDALLESAPRRYPQNESSARARRSGFSLGRE
jgi:cbb3-type cytochrome oxidase maturation protein